MTTPFANVHVHLPPNFSAFASVEAALDQAAAEGCRVFGTSNYYDFRVYEAFAEGARERGIEPTFGVEILCRDAEAADAWQRFNDPSNPGKVYLCGKALTGWSAPNPEAQAILDRIRLADAARMAEMAARLQAIFGGGPSAEDVRACVAERSGVPLDSVVLQERHLAEAYAGDPVACERAFGEPPKAMDAVGRQNEVRARLMKSGKPAFVEESYISVEEGIRLTRALGGVPSYPFVLDGMNPLSEMEGDLPALIKRLRAWGITYAEFIPNRNSAATLSRVVPALWDAGFTVTAGTEHNAAEPLPVRPQCKDGSPIPADAEEVFWASACTLVGLQAGATGDRTALRAAGEERIWTSRN